MTIARERKMYMRTNSLNKKSQREGMIIDNGNGMWYVEEYLNTSNVKVRLMGTNFTQTVQWYRLQDGHINNPYKLNKFGGYIGVDENNQAFNFKDKYINRAYHLWFNMLQRVGENEMYNNVSICSRWVCFANFLEDLPSIKGYDKWLLAGKYEYVLDKDIMQQGIDNKVYSADTCCFVTIHENLQYQDCNKPVTRG